jgi:hypothetical protein
MMVLWVWEFYFCGICGVLVEVVVDVLLDASDD